jgi:hypothetical protein
VTRDRARKKSVRAQMAASGEPYSVAARKLSTTAAVDEAAARDEVIARVEATLAAPSARFEVRKEVTAEPVTAPVRNRHRHGPFRRLAGVAVRVAWDRLVPEQARTAAFGISRGIIEPAARQFLHHQVKQDSGVLGRAMVISRAEFGGTPNSDVVTENPVELLLRLRSVTAARYAGDETIREARCRKIAVTVSGTTAVLTVWADNEHVRQIQEVTSKPTQGIAISVLVTTTVTAQLWDFGVPADSADWPPLPPAAGRVLPLIQRRVHIQPPRRSGQGVPVAGQW